MRDAKFNIGDKVHIKGKKSVLVIKDIFPFGNNIYYFVKNRVCAILEEQLILIKKNKALCQQQNIK